MLLSAPGRGPILSFDFPLSRSAAKARLAAFLPDAGLAYAERRGEERGPGQHQSVSRLSAALRRRLISEEEVAAAVVQAHGNERAATFLSELFWRTYWKGWLEQHPGVWSEWQAACARLAEDGLPQGYAQAVSGRTGIDAFDAWIGELRETGYLHNWARMQFASIWIFTLQLPWQLGAAFTLAQFVDGDAASNTLSWRWVAGLHTRGKAYLADAARIRERTGGRFDPQGLETIADVPRETFPALRCPVRRPVLPEADLASLLLLTPEDLSLETQPALSNLNVRGVVACRSHCSGAADIAAMADGLQRAGFHWGVPVAWVDDLDAVTALADTQQCEQIVTGYAAVGPIADDLARYRAANRLRLAEHRRAWDERAWPHCDRGYFALAKQTPDLLAAAGIGAAMRV